MRRYLREHQIHHEITDPHTPEQNGVAERLNRTIIEKAPAMVAHAGLHKKYWADGVNTALYIYNRVASSALSFKMSPYQAWYGRTPDLSQLRVFGCLAYAHVVTQRRKLDDKSQKLRLVDFSHGTRGYRLLDKETGRILYRRDVVFDEGEFNMRDKRDRRPEPEVVTLRTNSSSPNAPTPVVVPPEMPPVVVEPETNVRPQRIRTKPDRYGQSEVYSAYEENDLEHCAYVTGSECEPVSMREAQESADSDKWMEATRDEYQSLIDHETWELGPLPEGRSVVGSRWVFKRKLDDKGNVSRYKARLVAQGFSQRPGEDYNETFAPVARFGSIHTLLAYSVYCNMKIHQMDVKTAFLNGRLDEDIYMKQPEGFEMPGKEDLVCYLRRSLYGLKQSPRCWYEELKVHLMSLGFSPSLADPCVFQKWDDERLSIVTAYVDDLIIAVDVINDMEAIKSKLCQRFHMTDLGKLNICLGLSIIQGEGYLQLHQRQYVQEMLRKYGMDMSNTVSTPADTNVRLQEDDAHSKPADKQLFQRLLGSLQYAANCTRPDIAYAVNTAARYSSEPTESHLTALKRILRYLKETSHLALTYTRGDSNQVEGYSDADWAGDQDHRRSTSGNVFCLSSGAITWASRKQSSTALSAVEAEYVALSVATQEAMWLRQLMMELQNEKELPPTVLWEDNQGAIALAKNPVFHKRTKHIQIRYHFVRDAVDDKVIDVDFCPGKKMVADILTKPIPRVQFEYLRSQLGLKSIM